jgi:hypothetical protein
VRETGAAFGLEPKADVVVDGDLDDRCDVIFGDHDLESVRKFVIDHRNVEWLGMNVRDVSYQHEKR